MSNDMFDGQTPDYFPECFEGPFEDVPDVDPLDDKREQVRRMYLAERKRRLPVRVLRDVRPLFHRMLQRGRKA